jgi:CRISPR-associated exonuclease Cas4
MENPPSQISDAPEPLPLSLLNDFLFCHRRAGLKIVEGLRRANVHTLIGDLAHEHADLPGYEFAKGVTLLRALPVWSERLGLNGKCDIVEQHPGGALVPVEYKKSKRRHFDNDDVQLCAQALCLEEMFARPVERGAVFHAASKRRREVEFTAELRALTEQTAVEVHALLSSDSVPPAVLKPQCAECSLYEVCLPQLTSHPPGLDRAMRRLFETA